MAASVNDQSERIDKLIEWIIELETRIERLETYL